MYLPQAASLPPSIGAQPDLFRCMHLVWESWFEPTVAAFGTVVRPLHAQLDNSASVCRRGTGPILSRMGRGLPSLGGTAEHWIHESSASKGLCMGIILDEVFKLYCS
jgi:hypothetical protein